MRPLFGFSKLFDHEVPPVLDVACVRFAYASGELHARPAWCLDQGDRWVHLDGSRTTKHETDVVVRRATVHNGDWASLDWSDTSLVWPGAEAGWLAPDGTWFGCVSVWHEVVAEFVLRQPVAEVEKTYARVRHRGFTSPPQATGRLTPAQSAWLRARGYVCGDEAEFGARELARWESGAKRRGRGPRSGD